MFDPVYQPATVYLTNTARTGCAWRCVPFFRFDTFGNEEFWVGNYACTKQLRALQTVAWPRA
jgi:hypothetical protein